MPQRVSEKVDGACANAQCALRVAAAARLKLITRVQLGGTSNISLYHFGLFSLSYKQIR